METFSFPACQTRRFLEYNVKNECTTTYYLFLKKNFKQGSGSTADICSENYNQKLACKIVRKKRHKSIDFTALVNKMDVINKIADNTKLNQRKCVSQSKNMHIDTNSVGKSSYEYKGHDSSSVKFHFKKFNLNNLSSKSKDGRNRQIYSLV